MNNSLKWLLTLAGIVVLLGVIAHLFTTWGEAIYGDIFKKNAPQARQARPQQKIHSWTDKDGVKHFSNIQPEK